jgi:serine protease
MSRPFGRAAARTITVALAASLALAASAPALAKAEKTIPTLRVMLNPSTAPRGSLPDGARLRIESMVGAPVTIAAITRTGALDLQVGGPRDRNALLVIAGKLRTDRSVLWAEVAETQTVRPKSAIAAKAAQQPSRKLLVRFEDGADAATAVNRLSALAGVPAVIERSIGAVQVIALSQTLAMSDLEALAKRFETDAAVRYADPVRRATAYRVPNDPLFSQQWSLTNVNASMAWDTGTGSSSVTVAIVDTGILDHPDLAGRVLPGHDFILDVESARDGDARDSNPRDEGDWHEDGDCGGFAGQSSFFHGLFIAGQIAANADNDVGVAGLDWAAKILPVRVLGKCGGTFDDIAAGVAWAAGLAVQGAPANPNPAKVVNLSLGGFGSCPAALQEFVDDALAQGTAVVAAAGNESDDASFFSPANCSGVITVGALGRTGDRSSFSNFGLRVDISAPGGDVDADGQILSTHAAGDTVPGDFSYDLGVGTSFAAPLVSGTLSLMLGRNPNLTVGQALSLLQGSALDFQLNTTCSFGGFCGIGALNAAGAMASTLPAVVNLPAGAVAVIEYYDAALDHYLMTSDPTEIQDLDQSARWQRTGHVFYAWADPSSAPFGVFPRGVCRFYAGPLHLIDSFYFTADPAECNSAMNNPVWTLQSTAAFWVEVPDIEGNCREGTLPVYRFFNGRRDASQRHTIDLSVRRAMGNRVWVADGKGANGAAMCSLI